MFSKIKKAIINYKLIKQNIEKKNKDINIEKNKFNEEWGKWGMKKSDIDKIM